MEVIYCISRMVWLMLICMIVDFIHVANATEIQKTGCDETTDISDVLSEPWKSSQQSLQSIECLADAMYARGDCIGVFLYIYKYVTLSISSAISQKEFINNTWRNQYLIGFANLYRISLWNFHKGNQTAMPGSWVIALQQAHDDAGLVLQYILLGMNAHINRDLAHAIYGVGTEPNRDEKIADHEKVNGILAGVFNTTVQVIAEKYEPILAKWYGMDSSAENAIFSIGMKDARELAWDEAVQMTDVPQNATSIEEKIEKVTTEVANLIIEMNQNSEFLQLARELEGPDHCISVIEAIKSSIN